MDIYKRLKEEGLEIPPPLVRPTSWCFEPFVKHENILYLSGHGPRFKDQIVYTGRLGENLDLDTGRKAAELCILNLLSTIEIALGNLNRVERIIKVFGMVKCTPDFHMQPEIINGGSELLLKIFGDNGKHARSAVGMYDLPRGIPVEIEMTISYV